MADYDLSSLKIGAVSLGSGPVQLQASGSAVAVGDVCRISGNTGILSVNDSLTNVVVTHFVLTAAADTEWFSAAPLDPNTILELGTPIGANLELYVSSNPGKLAPVADITTGMFKSIAAHSDGNGFVRPTGQYTHGNALA